ncbi:hypothetical protein RRG08_046148 [Elysia crispata]|uniref:Dynein heavy chain ATP-binding dynein motor region domain-containing protein n=1 Tax=Elysia crispata TaxID=231223 RepID=A0AAE1A422_9GAST|nr:hypothetical protein RRG08_046148 [Elysia crispata]
MAGLRSLQGQCLTSIIDFTVTQKGLEDQLLGRVIVTEKYESILEMLAFARMSATYVLWSLTKETKELEENVRCWLHVTEQKTDEGTGRNLLWKLTSSAGL